MMTAAWLLVAIGAVLFMSGYQTVMTYAALEVMIEAGKLQGRPAVAPSYKAKTVALLFGGALLFLSGLIVGLLGLVL